MLKGRWSVVDDETFDNPYDPNVPDLEPQTLPMDEVIRRAIQAALMRLHTWLPGQITEIQGNGRVTVQPMLQSRYITGQLVTLPPIQNVIYQQPRGANFSIKLPIAVGDTGRISFCERSLDVWSVSGGIVDPADTRHHNMTDAVFTPGLYPFDDQIEDNSTDLVLTAGKAIVRMQQSGNLLLGGPNVASPAVLGDVLITALDGIIAQIQAICDAISNNATSFILVTGAPGGPSPANPAIAIALAAAKSALTNLKSQYVDTASSNFASQQVFLQRGGS